MKNNYSHGERGPEHSPQETTTIIMSAGEGRLMRVDVATPADKEPWVMVVQARSHSLTGGEPLQILSQVDTRTTGLVHHTMFYTTINEQGEYVRRCDYFDEYTTAPDDNDVRISAVIRDQPIRIDTMHAPSDFSPDALLLHCQPGSRSYTMQEEKNAGELDMPADAEIFDASDTAHRKIAFIFDTLDVRARL